MEDISNLCRICSSPGWHDIYKPIPRYAHCTPQEADDWQKPICVMITETTGLKVSRTDQLPQKICTLCITYMKHACVFRNQAQDNIRSLRAAQLIGYKEKRTVKELMADRKTTFIAIDDVVHEPDDLLSGMYDDNEDEEVVEELPEGCQYSALKETCFEEDDVINDELMKNFNISINTPETYKERKCPCCNRRHMLNETFDEHLKICVHYKLVKFITLCKKLLEIKTHKKCSPHEFVRRMIHAIKEVVKEIHYFCEDFTDLNLPIKPSHQGALNKAAALLVTNDPKHPMQNTEDSKEAKNVPKSGQKITQKPKLTPNQVKYALHMAKLQIDAAVSIKRQILAQKYLSSDKLNVQSTPAPTRTSDSIQNLVQAPKPPNFPNEFSKLRPFRNHTQNIQKTTLPKSEHVPADSDLSAALKFSEKNETKDIPNLNSASNFLPIPVQKPSVAPVQSSPLRPNIDYENFRRIPSHTIIKNPNLNPSMSTSTPYRNSASFPNVMPAPATPDLTATLNMNSMSRDSTPTDNITSLNSACNNLISAVQKPPAQFSPRPNDDDDEAASSRLLLQQLVNKLNHSPNM